MKNNPVPSCAILTYHSQNVAGDWAPVNDHDALAADLDAINAAGLEIISLDLLMDRLEQPLSESPDRPMVCLTFDDGCDLDVRDLDFPGAGLQRSFLGILKDFVNRHGTGTQPGLHATSFVIASPVARHAIDERSLFGKGWMSDDWWPETNEMSLLSLGNHGWDHRHPDTEPGNEALGSFLSVDSPDSCQQQVVAAARHIAEVAGRWPGFFAYPFGQSSRFIRETYMPAEAAVHQHRAALGTDPGFARTDSDRWNLPRFVSGRDWKSSRELLTLLTDRNENHNQDQDL